MVCLKFFVGTRCCMVNESLQKYDLNAGKLWTRSSSIFKLSLRSDAVTKVRLIVRLSGHYINQF